MARLELPDETTSHHDCRERSCQEHWPGAQPVAWQCEVEILPPTPACRLDVTTMAVGSEPPVLVLEQGPVGTVVLNRPAKRNALTLQMWGLVRDAFRQFDANPSVRVVVLRGADPSAFAAGADISEFRDRRSAPTDAAIYNSVVEDAERSIAACRKPTVAVVQGPCIGGGCELAVACDFRFSDPSATFAIPVAKLGLIYGLAATHRLVGVVGPTIAKWLLFTGAIVDAEEAARIGLVSKLTQSATLYGEVDDFVSLLCHRSRTSQEGVKQIMAMDPRGDSDAARLVNEANEGADYKEGVSAFLEKRDPIFE